MDALETYHKPSRGNQLDSKIEVSSPVPIFLMIPYASTSHPSIIDIQILDGGVPSLASKKSPLGN
jgi:hypothetical protein